MNLRLLRVCELIKRELGVIIGRDIRFEAPLVSVRAVDITPDLKNAHVFISAIGTKWQKDQALQQLTDKRQHLQHELSRRVVIKYTPHLHFQLDESIERGTRVINLLDEIDHMDSLAQSHEDKEGQGSMEEEDGGLPR